MGSSRMTVLERRRRTRRRAKLKAALPAAGAVRALTRKSRPRGPLAVVTHPSWKLLGLAGVAGVAATGVVVARSRRAQRDVAPEELRERLHKRLATIEAEPPQQPPRPSA